MATKHEIIGEEWAERAGELAEWAMEKLVNRKDVWGQYSVLTPSERRREGKSYKAMTLPKKDMRGEDMVTLDKLTRHFASRHHRKPQIIGLHAKSKTATSKWFGIDIDMHDADKVNAEDHARRNLNGALKWWKDLQTLGYDPLLFDTNGYGGFHIWVLFDEPAPTHDTYEMVKKIAESWSKNSLDEEPETFPKRVKEESIGSWFRLPGLHHTRYHYSRVWSGDDWLDDPWLDGHAAIDALLEVTPGPPPPKSTEPAEKRSRVTARTAHRHEEDVEPPTAAARKSRFTRTKKGRICVDLDGVLVGRSKGSRKTSFGAPIDGAADFMKELSAKAEIVIFTSRLAIDDQAERKEVATKIEAWLEKNNIAYDEVFIGSGKPMAIAYVDDRGVACRPQEDGVKAFASAMDAVDTLL